VRDENNPGSGDNGRAQITFNALYAEDNTIGISTSHLQAATPQLTPRPARPLATPKSRVTQGDSPVQFPA
jgi:hypothetical protein